MPEMHFHLRWPDGEESRCYSPSLVVREHLTPGQAYPMPEFLHRTRTALHVASERVRVKYGFACSAAMDQWQRIEDTASRFEHQPGARVEVIGFDPE